MPTNRPPCVRWGRNALLFCAAAMLAVAVVPGCAPSAKTKKKEAAKTPEERTMQSIDARYASYGITWNDGAQARESRYKLTYVMKGGDATVVEGETDGFSEDTPGTTPREKVGEARRRERVKNYILMSPITAIIGEPTTYEVGKTYDGAILRPDGSPQFQYTCERVEEIAGVKGYRLIIVGTKEKKTELELVLSPDFPFPLYVKEHTGEDPLQIFLTDAN